MTGGPRQVGGGRRAIGDSAPELAELTDDVLFEDVWNRDGLAARDRSPITVAALHGSADPLDSPCRRPPAQQHPVSTTRHDHSGASS